MKEDIEMVKNIHCTLMIIALAINCEVLLKIDIFNKNKFLIKMSLNRTWYMQLSKANFINLTTVMKNKFPGNIIYELGNAKMSILPNVGDMVIVLGNKHRVTNGIIIDSFNSDTGLQYVVALGEINPVANGMFFRKNWTLKIENFGK